MIAEDYPTLDVFPMLTPLLTRILPFVEEFIRRSGILKEDIPAFLLERYCHPQASQLFRKQTIDIEIYESTPLRCC